MFVVVDPVSLLSQTTFNAAGWVGETRDPNGIPTRDYYDMVTRQTNRDSRPFTSNRANKQEAEKTAMNASMSPYDRGDRARPSGDGKKRSLSGMKPL